MQADPVCFTKKKLFDCLNSLDEIFEILHPILYSINRGDQLLYFQRNGG
ncbi:hypothetical protein GCWU000341_00197 [Oribacterium sp. oral taxon 078 str. F0262]|nr:hypothetical protein GCWU000341_00197 [Oribacterium sp. oral taxon 078 str. F0262]